MEGRFTEVKVWVNGTFDVLHIGHIKLLEFASQFGEIRVGIDTDERVKQFKGELRPINNINDRIFFMNSIKYVNISFSF
jgi:D-beta-D-heptose 7-phosphate kinase/D-beta-D-heptose 1-phosphate adenosyltransferase